MSGSKKSEGSPPDPAAAQLAQQLLSQIQHDFVAAPAAEKERAAVTAQSLLGQLHEDFVVKEQQKKAAASNLANALLNKVSRDFGSIPPAGSGVASTTVQSDAELEAAGAQGASLSEQELAELDAMTAPTGFWGKLVARLRGKKRASK